MKITVKNISAAVLVCASMSLASCSDFLDKQASNELSEAKTYADWNMFEYFHNDTYNFLLHGAHRINNSWLDAATDLSETSFATGGTRVSFNIGNYYAGGGSAELTSVWESRYRGIRKCNRVINDIDKVPNDKTKDEATEAHDRALIVAEARTFRAWFYWELFLRFGPLPIVTEVLDPDSDDLVGPYKERPTLSEYIGFILKELRECRADLYDYDDAWNTQRIGRLSQPMSMALEARIMLYMASPRFAANSGVTWQQAYDAQKKFMDTYGGKFALYVDATNPSGMTNYSGAVLRTAHRDGNKETIFFRNDGTVGWGEVSMDTPVGEGGSGGNCPSQNLVDMYDMIDGSAPFTQYDATGAPVYNSNGMPTVNAASGYNDANMWANRDPRFDATVLYHGVEWGSMNSTGYIDVRRGMADNPIGNANATPTGYYMRKYIPATILASNHAGADYRLWTIIRYAEILLSRAEALNEIQGPCAEVYDLLDQVRHRAGIVGNVADRTDLNSKEAMRNFIHKERTVEFAFEEHRSWDVRRWNVAVEALSRPIYGIEVAQNGTISRKVAQSRVFTDNMYLYPIPEEEYWKTGIENNPGWK